MGFLRLYLAFLVALDHAGFGAFVMTFQATTAVQCFFIVSGFYMAATYTRNYAYAGGALGFYASRFLRLYPLYLATVGLTALAYWGSLQGWWKVNAFDVFNYFEKPSPGALFEFSVYSMFLQDILSINSDWHHALPIRQAWSISAEVAFYAFTPLLVVWRRGLIPLIILAFIGKYVTFKLYGFQYSYYPFYTEIVYFLVGVAAYFHRDRLTLARRQTVLLSGAALLFSLMVANATLERGGLLNNIVLMVGMAFLVPSLFTHYNGVLQAKIGDYSYGVYITHLLFIDLAKSNLPDDMGYWKHALTACFTIVGSMALTHVFNINVQEPIDRIRRRWFQKKRV